MHLVPKEVCRLYLSLTTGTLGSQQPAPPLATTSLSDWQLAAVNPTLRRSVVSQLSDAWH